MTIFIHTQSDVIFNAIESFFKEKEQHCQRSDASKPPQDFSCLVLDAPCLSTLKEYKKTPHSPVIVLVDSGSMLTSAFTFLEKPLKLEELFQHCIKLSNSNGQKAFSMGPYTLFPKTRYALHTITGVQCSLTEKEIAILEVLYQAKETVSKEAILENVWGYQSDIDTHTLETHIYKLRKKLFAENEEEFILTYPRGYRLKV